MNDVICYSRKKFDYRIIDITGDIELEDVNYVKTYIDSNLDEGINSLVLNLERVAYMNNSALSLFIELMEESRRKGTKFYLMNVTPRLDALLIRANIKKYLTILESEELLTEQAKSNDLNAILEESI